MVAESQWIEAGTSIRIVFAEGYRHVVRPVDVVEGGGEGGAVGKEPPAEKPPTKSTATPAPESTPKPPPAEARGSGVEDETPT